MYSIFVSPTWFRERAPSRSESLKLDLSNAPSTVPNGPLDVEKWGCNYGCIAATPRCQFRDTQAEPRETDAIFGFSGSKNPYLPNFMFFGAQGRAGEGSGTWGAAQGPGGMAGKERRGGRWRPHGHFRKLLVQPHVPGCGPKMSGSRSF